MTVVKSLRTGEQEAEFRQLWSYLYEQVSTGKAKQGVVSGCAVSATSPSASGSVVIGTGLAIAQPTTGGGAFPFLVTAAETVDVFTTNPMQFVNNPRTDIVGIDQTTGAAAVLTGTPNAIPVAPTVPSTFIPLAQLRHAANATTIPASVIDDLRTMIRSAGDGRSAAKAGKRFHWSAYTTAATDSGGYVTVTHNAGFTPTSVLVTAADTTFASKHAYASLTCDMFTATTFRMRAVDPAAGAGIGAQAFTISAMLGE